MTEKSGIINVYKEPGYTSFDVVAIMRGILKEKKIGHMGTLDPMASGVLPLMVGSATSAGELFASHRKTYLASMRFGSETDTQDSTGTVTAEKDYVFSENEFREALFSFVGNISQIPPMYSAKKVNGVKLLSLARAGVECERKACSVTVYSIELTALDEYGAAIRVECSGGTYIRTLCTDIGRKCGYLAHMTSLEREALGDFRKDTACRISEIETMAKSGDLSFIQPLDKVLGGLASFTVPACDEKYLLNGNILSYPEGTQGCFPALNDKIKIYDHSGIFRAIYRVAEIKPEGIFVMRAYKMFV